MIHIYCGEGKGKTSAAFGMILRAAGSGMKVMATQFLKDGTSSETVLLKKLPGVIYVNSPAPKGFVWNMKEEEKEQFCSRIRTFFTGFTERAEREQIQLLVMDEFMSAYHYNFIDHKEALEFLKKNRESMEIVLTGRDPSKELLDIADYISDIQKIRHPYDCGVSARKGIEY